MMLQVKYTCIQQSNMRALFCRNFFMKCGLWRHLLLVVALGFVHIALAQNNPYKISDKLYPIYKEAYRYRSMQRGVALADSLYNKAVEMDDKKAQCLALSIYVAYHFHAGNDEPFFKAVEAMEQKALATGYKQYFYFGRTFRIDYLIRKGRFGEAVDYALKYAKDARVQHDNYSMFYALNEMGKVHRERTEITLAIKAFEEALEVGEKYVKDQDMGTIYRKIAECYGMLFEYQRMYEVSLKGYAASRTVQTRLRSLRNLMFAQLKMQNYDKVRHYYDLFVKVNGGPPQMVEPGVMFYEVKAMKLIADGDIAAAAKALDSFPPTWDGQKFRLYMDLYLREGNYLKLYDARQHYYDSRIYLQDSIQANDLQYLAAAMYNSKMDFDNRKLLIDRQRMLNDRQQADIANANLELANTQLGLSNSSLELQRTRSDAELMRISLSNKKFEASRLKSKVAAERAYKETLNLRAFVLILALSLVIVAALLYLSFYKRATRRLRKTHNELAITHTLLDDARKRAELADRMKTALLQNMTAEINEPLNSVAGFAQLIADANATTTAEERAEYYKQLSSNTARMLDIVGKVLEDIQHE